MVSNTSCGGRLKFNEQLRSPVTGICLQQVQDIGNGTLQPIARCPMASLTCGEDDLDLRILRHSFLTAVTPVLTADNVRRRKCVAH